MDPNKALQDMLDLTDKIEQANDGDHFEAAAMLGGRLADLVVGLHTWLVMGGFPPEAWREGPDANG